VKPYSGYSLSVEEINHSINKGIDFLYTSQKNFGFFKTDICSDVEMTHCDQINPPFTTATIFYSLEKINSDKNKIMLEKSLQSLQNQKQNGTWRFLYDTIQSQRQSQSNATWKFWENSGFIYLPADLDDTSLASFILKSNNISVNNELIFNQNKNPNGLFYTWINISERYNDVDCVVNANVLLYLGNNSEVCSYINNAIINNERCSMYYPNELNLYYALSRDLNNNVTCFSINKEIIIKRILLRQKGDGSFGNNLDTALALNTLMNLDYSGGEISLGIKNLLTQQNRDGSWKKEPYFSGVSYVGSDELSTAISVEALNKFLLFPQL
jgi:hypothetical protein